jgi:hypothetical protein
VNNATKIAEATQDAYSFEFYGADEWLLLVMKLLKTGFTAGQVEWILRSKYTRWARDTYAQQSEGRADYFLMYLANPGNHAMIARDLKDVK